MVDDIASTQVWGGGGDRHGSAMPMVLMYHSVAPCEEDPYGITVSPAGRPAIFAGAPGCAGCAAGAFAGCQ